ncbi:MAG: hypothetical protein AAFX79_09785 [Planctomycetota bacterium]
MLPTGLVRVADSSFHLTIEALLQMVQVVSGLAALRAMLRLARFVGLLRLFKAALARANARLGVVRPLHEFSASERRLAEGGLLPSERGGPPMVF